MTARLDSNGFFEIDGVKLEYRWIDGKDAGKPTLVYLHEGLGSVALWKDFPDRVAEASGCAALVYSRQGYGESDPADLPRGVEYMHTEGLEVLPKVLDAAGLKENVVLVGHSDGGSISIIHASTDKSGRIAGLILFAPHVFNEELCVNSIRQAKTVYETTDLREKLGRYHKDVDNAFWGWNDIWLHPDFWHWNIEEYLPAVRQPILHVQGEDDEYGTIKQPDAIKAQAGGPVEVVMLPDCKHSPNRDQPEKTIAAMQRFIDSLPKTEEEPVARAV